VGGIYSILQCGQVKVKVHPRRGDKGPEGEEGYNYTLALTSSLDGVGGQRHAPTALPPTNTRYNI